MERRAVLGLALAPVVEAGSGDIGVPQPLLDLGNVCFMGEGVCRRRRPQRMHTQPDHFKVDSGLAPVFPDDVAVDGTRFQMLVQRPCAVVFHGTEEGTV